MNQNSPKFSFILRYYMNEKNCSTIECLADRTGLTRQAISAWLNRHIQPSIGSVLKCSTGLGLSKEEQNKLLHSAGYPSVDLGHKTSESENKPITKPEENTPKIVTTVPVQRVIDFFGRTYFLETVFAVWDRPVFEHIAITGEKRSGKTSVLNYLKNIHTTTELREGQKQDWLNEELLWVYVDFRHKGSMKLESLLRFLLKNLKLSIPDVCDLDYFTETIEDELTMPAIILMDDIEYGLESEELDQSFWNTMRHLASSPAGRRIGFCVTSRQNPAQLEAKAAELGKPSPFFNTFISKALEPFTREEAEDFLSCMGIETADSLWIIENLGTWPVVLQESCKIRLDALKYAQKKWQADCLALQEKYAYLTQLGTENAA